MDDNEDPDAMKRTARSDIPRPHECATRREAITPTVDPYVRRAEQRRRVRTTRTVGRQTRSRASVTSPVSPSPRPDPPCRLVAAAPSPYAAQPVAEAAGYSGWVARAVPEIPGRSPRQRRQPPRRPDRRPRRDHCRSRGPGRIGRNARQAGTGAPDGLADRASSTTPAAYTSWASLRTRPERG